MILAELTGHLSRRIQAGVAIGELPAEAAHLTAHGTWRPAPAAAPGAYATSLPFRLARLTATTPEAAARYLAAAFTGIPGVSHTRAANGYLTISTTPARLAIEPARIAALGPAVPRSDALAGRKLTTPGLPDLARAPTWPQAWRSQHEALLGRLADAAGADVKFSDAERMLSSAPPVWAGDSTPESAVRGRGVDAVRYALVKARGPSASLIEAELSRPLDLANPFVLVRHAHADAASVRRWAADLGLAPPPGSKATTGVIAALHPAELAVIDQLTWLPERVAAACRRARPAELASYLENLAGRWLDCAELCPALPFRGGGAVGVRAEEDRAFRLVLADATGATLAAGLELIGVAAPDRI